MRRQRELGRRGRSRRILILVAEDRLSRRLGRRSCMADFARGARDPSRAEPRNPAVRLLGRQRSTQRDSPVHQVSSYLPASGWLARLRIHSHERQQTIGGSARGRRDGRISLVVFIGRSRIQGCIISPVVAIFFRPLWEQNAFLLCSSRPRLGQLVCRRRRWTHKSCSRALGDAPPTTPGETLSYDRPAAGQVSQSRLKPVGGGQESERRRRRRTRCKSKRVSVTRANWPPVYGLANRLLAH